MIKVVEIYTQKWSGEAAAQFKYKQNNQTCDDGWLTGVSFFPKGCADRNGRKRVAALVWSSSPWTGTDEDYEEVELLAKFWQPS